MCYFDDAIRPDVFEEDMIKARKSHTCCECGSEIRPGETYQRVKGLWDGSWSNHKTCLRCVKLRRMYGGPPYTCLREAIFEETGSDPFVEEKS